MLPQTSAGNRFHSLQAQAALRIGLPLLLIITGLVALGSYAYNRIIASLVIERHRQIADLTAASVSEVLEGYANVLEAMASKNRLQSPSLEDRLTALQEAEDALTIFDAGVYIVDDQGVVTTESEGSAISFFSEVSAFEIFQSVRSQMAPSFSNAVLGEEANDAFVLVAVPLLDASDRFAGAVIGAMDLHSASIHNPIRKLTLGKDGFAFLVDRNGVILAHPDPQKIGIDSRNQPFVQRAIAGESGGMITKQPAGERQVEGYAPIKLAGWGLIIQESWSSITEPIGLFSTLVILIGLAVIVLVVLLTWKGFQRIAGPIQALQGHTEKLTQGENIEATREWGITEIDALEHAFLRMAAQISSYRSGLHRYIGAITNSQEEERKRIARELHDETIQSLLAITRRLELFQSLEDDPQRQENLAEIRKMVSASLAEIRQINRDLRPLILEDLGLIAALQTLVRAARQGEGAIPHARFETIDGPMQADLGLDPEQEQTLYRITQEALTNIRKHACATGLTVRLASSSGKVRLDVIDDGRGFEVPSYLTDFAQDNCFGLLGIQERVWAAGGTLSIQSSPGKGTKLSVTIPVSARLESNSEDLN